uniref:Cell division protein sepF n=1 Tax=Cyanophora paradoxa TaxID=2762 RepID=A0A097PB38_CYAPA|nr:cell division protein sepF [Cyanophora paradoxa]
MTFDYPKTFYNNTYDEDFEIVIFKPQTPVQLQQCLMESLIALRLNKAVIFNFEYIEYSEAQRILDSLAGATYALQGDKTCIAEKLYFFVPKIFELEVAGGNESKLLYY